MTLVKLQIKYIKKERYVQMQTITALDNININNTSRKKRRKCYCYFYHLKQFKYRIAQLPKNVYG